MIWRVKVKYSYNELFFDFESSEEAANFCITLLKSFNKKESYDKKDLYVSMFPFNEEVENTDDDD